MFSSIDEMFAKLIQPNLVVFHDSEIHSVVDYFVKNILGEEPFRNLRYCYVSENKINEFSDRERDMFSGRFL